MNAAPQTSAPSTRPWQWIGGLGIAYSILYFLGALLLLGSPPGENASPAKLTSYYADHKTSTTLAVFIIVFAMVVFGLFVSALRRALSRSGRDGDHFAVVTVVGSAVYISGFVLAALLELALVDAGHHQAGAAAQTLNYLVTDDWVPIVAGLSLTALGTGIAGLRNRTLPGWLAWASVVLGVLAVAGPVGGIAYIITPLWTLALGIVLARSVAQAPVTAVVGPATPVPTLT